MPFDALSLEIGTYGYGSLSLPCLIDLSCCFPCCVEGYICRLPMILHLRGWRVSVAKLIYRMYFRIVEKQRGNCVRREVYHPGNSTLESRFYTIDVFTQSVPPEKFNAGISNTKYCLVDKLTRLFEFRRSVSTVGNPMFFFF